MKRKNTKTKRIVKIHRLENQISELNELIEKTNSPGVRGALLVSIKKRKCAIKYLKSLKKKELSWVEIMKKFKIKYYLD